MVRPLTKEAQRRLRQARAYQRRRSYALAFLGGACALCGATEGPLEIDHVNPHQKRFGVLTRWSVSWQKWHDELELCQLLCPPCHHAKTAEERRNPRARVEWAIARGEVPF